MIKNLTIQARTRDEMMEAIKYYIHNLPVPSNYALEIRIDWAACPMPDYYGMDGKLLARTIPMP